MRKNRIIFLGLFLGLFLVSLTNAAVPGPTPAPIPSQIPPPIPPPLPPPAQPLPIVSPSAVQLQPRPQLTDFFKVFTVNSTDDQPDLTPSDGICGDSSGACTLRAAIQTANATAGLGATIVLEANTYTLKIPKDPINDPANTGAITITKNLTIVGKGPGKTFITVLLPGKKLGPEGLPLTPPTFKSPLPAVPTTKFVPAEFPNDGIFKVEPANGATSLTVQDLTIQSGRNENGFGGAINFEGGTGGVLTIEKSHIAGCTAQSGGAAFIKDGKLILKNSTLSSNSSTLKGGALLVQQANAEIFNSTIAGNTSKQGGGIRAEPEVLAAAAGSIDIKSSTIARNEATLEGGGLSLSNSEVKIENSILAENKGVDCTSDGKVVSAGHNFFGDVTGCTVIPDLNLTDKTGDPLLDQMVVVEGFPPILPLKPDSPAIDAGNEGTCPGTEGKDEVGAPRPKGPRCDIGAVEAQFNVAKAGPPVFTPTRPTPPLQTPPPPDQGVAGEGANRAISGGGLLCSLGLGEVSFQGMGWNFGWILLVFGYGMRRIFKAR